MLDNAFNTLNSSKEDDSMLEVTGFLKAGEVDDLSFITSANFEIVSTFVRALLKHSLDRVSNPDVIAPILPFLDKRLTLADNYA